MFYEVFIPSTGSDGFDVTITVEADNWMTALKSGLERTGQGADAIRNVMCDIKEDNTIHVTDASTARVFVLREVEPEAEVDSSAAPVVDEIVVDEAGPTAPDDAGTKDTLLDLGPKPADTTMPMKEVPEPPPEPTAEDEEVANLATQRMEPIHAPPLSTNNSPRPTTTPGYSTRGKTQPRHKPPPGAPPPEATGKFDRVPSKDTGPKSGTHSPPPGAPPPVVARQSGQNQAIDKSQLESKGGTQPLTPTGPASGAPPTQQPPPQAAPPPSSVVPTQSQPDAATTPQPAVEAQAAPPPAQRAPDPEPAPVAPKAASLDEYSDPGSDLPDVPVTPEGLEERSWTSEDGRMRIGSATFEALQREEPSEAKVVRETRSKSGERQAIDIGRAQESVSQNALEEVFLEINQIHEGDMSMEQVINYVMDLSMSKINAEAGSIMFADVNGRELYFATARGPKAQDVMDFRVPMSKGLVGFCAREGVSLAISDAEKDPRFFKEISVKIGYETKNVCCAPIQFEGRVYGAVELMNKSTPFTNTEVNVLTYIGRQLAKFVNDLIMAREKI